MRRLLSLLLFLPLLAQGQTEIGFVERFALATDRERVLEQLVPGTEDFYYYHALHYQLTAQNAKLQETLKQWAARLPSERLPAFLASFHLTTSVLSLLAHQLSRSDDPVPRVSTRQTA